MEEDILNNYSELKNKLLQYTYKQLIEFLEFKVIAKDKRYIAFQRGNNIILLFVLDKTNTLALYDLLKGKFIEKDEFFYTYYYLSSAASYFRAINKIPLGNEYSFEEACNEDEILKLFYFNLPRSKFPGKYVTFDSMASHPWFNKFITYNEKLKRFSLPLFNTSDFVVNNFVDFADKTFSFRFKTNFSIFYPVNPSTAYQIIKTPDDNLFTGSEYLENDLIISFNPFLLIESSIHFKINNINYLPVLLEPDFSILKYIQFYLLVNPSVYEKIILLYSIEKLFFKKDLINITLFLIYTINFSQKQYYFEYNICADEKLIVILTRYPQSTTGYDITHLLTTINKTYIDEFSGVNSSDLVADIKNYNINFLDSHGINSRFHKIGSDQSFIIDIPLKVETCLIFCRWLINKYLKNVSLYHVSGNAIFNDVPF